MPTVPNAKGVLLPYSGSSVSHFSATNSGPQLFGSARNDSLWGDSRVNVTMYGGLGDDIYHLYSSINRASEQAGGGIDTVETWMSYTLPENIENLTVTGGGRFAIGNAANNIISGGSGQQTIDGGLGDDVLKGGTGADIFIFKAATGSDLILDFENQDTVRLNGYGFSSFDEVRANMVQTGTDVRLNLGQGEELVFANATVNQFAASQFKLSLDRSALSLSFADEFDTLSLRSGVSGTWNTNFWWGGENGSTLSGNGEKQWYIDHEYGPTSSVDPFSVDDGVLTITAARAPDAIRPYINNYEYTSGLLNTHEFLFPDLRLFRDPRQHAGQSWRLAGVLAVAGGRFLAAGTRCGGNARAGPEHRSCRGAYERDRQPHDRRIRGECAGHRRLP